MAREGNTLKLVTEPFFFDGAGAYLDGKFVHYDFSVKCADEALSFTKDKCKLHTKTVDGFVAGNYKASNGIELPYWLYMPEDTAPVPLMVWLHGGGEVLETSYKGANLTKNRGATCWIESGRKTAVLSVQFPKNYAFGISAKPEELKMMEEYNVVQYELIQELISDGKIDAKRVYVSGASSGGGAVLRFIMQYPDFFAAALPICAKDTLIPISEPYGLAFKMQGSLEISDEAYEKCYNDISCLMQQYSITNVPIWFVQAENDPVCTSYTSKIMYDVLNKMGAVKNKISMYGDQEMRDKNAPFLHASWIPAFNDTEIIDWIYAQSK
jgi:predicted peptidase